LPKCAGMVMLECHIKFTIMMTPARVSIISLLASLALSLQCANAQSRDFRCKGGGINQQFQNCSISFSKARLEGSDGYLTVYRLADGYTVKRFTSADFSTEKGMYPRYETWLEARWEVSNSSTNECSLYVEDPYNQESYPVLTTSCGD